MSEVQPQFECPQCKRRFPWKPQTVGKKGKCPCGQVMNVPAAPIAVAGGEAEPDMYALAEAGKAAKQAEPVVEAAVAAEGVCPSCGAALVPGAVLCVECGYNLKAGKKLQTQVEHEPPLAVAVAAPARSGQTGAQAVLPYRSALKPEKGVHDVIEGSHFKDLYLPLGLIVLGVLSQFGMVAYAHGWKNVDVGSISIEVTIRIVISLVLMLVGIVIAAKIADMGFGTPLQAIVKLCAIALMPGAIGEIIGIALGGGFTGNSLGGLVSIVIYWGLFALLFDLDLQETMICVSIIWIIQMFVVVFVMQILMAMLMGM